MKRKITFSLSEEAITRLKELAKEDKRSASGMLEVLILRGKEERK